MFRRCDWCWETSLRVSHNNGFRRRRRSLVPWNQGQLFRSTNTAAKWEPGVIGVRISPGMTRQTERTILAANALRLDLFLASHSVVMARCTEVFTTATADKESDRAAVHAFPFNELVAMFNTHRNAVAELLCLTFPTEQSRLLKAVFRLHCLYLVFHSSEIWDLTFKALIERAVVDGECGKVVEVDVAFLHDSSSLIVALFNGHL